MGGSFPVMARKDPEKFREYQRLWARRNHWENRERELARVRDY